MLAASGDGDTGEIRFDLHEILAEHRRTSHRIHGLVFGRTATQPFVSSTANQRVLRAWNIRRLEPGGLHEARHTYASC